ncbi:unknown [Clostridium sp. CAG:492]|nr:unknown [Clostridium sp. CAG:492]
MKKVKIISMTIIAMLCMSLMSNIFVAYAEENVVQPNSYNPIQMMYEYSKNAAGQDVAKFNSYVEEKLVNVDQMKKDNREIIDFSNATNFSKFADDKLDLDDVAIFKDFLNVLALNETGGLKNTAYANLKSFFANKVGNLSSFSMEISLNTKNGKSLNAKVEDNSSNSFAVQYKSSITATDNTEREKQIYEKICTEAGGTLATEADNVIDNFCASMENLMNNASIKINANNEVYYLVFGYTSDKTTEGRYKVNAYLITDKKADKNFSTDLSYEAFIGTKDVGGTTENGTFKPNYDSSDIKKDADVTAIIKSKTDEDIIAVDGVALDKEGKPNEKGWYYIDVDNKKQIAKKYLFETYNNSTLNGMVTEKNVPLTGANGGKDEQTVSIKWPFRIIDKTYDPETPTNDTKEVKVTVTTNLPMDPDKIPEGWTIVPDTDNHKITRTYKKGENVDTNITVYQNGTGDTAKTDIKYSWPGDNTVSPSPISKTGEKFNILLIVAGAAVIIAIIVRRKRNKIK